MRLFGKLNPQWKGGRSKCEICKKDLTDYRSNRCRKHIKPMSEKTKKILSEQRMGSNNPMFGKKLSDEHRKKLSIINKDRCGTKNPNWRGTTPLNKAIRELPQMRELKIATFKRDGRSCRCCGSKKNIEAHHIVSLSEMIYQEQLRDIETARKCKRLFDKKNVITLCSDCHKLTKNYGCSSFKYFVDDRGIIQDILVDEIFNSMVDITFEPGAVRGNHKHKMSKQVDYIADGLLLVFSGDKKRIVGAGETITHLPGVPHAYKAITKSRLLSFICGIRQGKNYSKDTYKLETPLV